MTYKTELVTIRILRGYTKEIWFDLIAIGTHAVILSMP